jgi:hypothetical protein
MILNLHHRDTEAQRNSKILLSKKEIPPSRGKGYSASLKLQEV